MTTTRSTLVPIAMVPGVQPSTDKSPLATTHYTMSDKVRFRFGFPQKIGGWIASPIAAGAAVYGKARSMFSGIINNSVATLIGSHARLHSLYGSVLTNITPLLTSSTTIANSLTTDYATLGSNPISTVNGSNVLTITDTNYSLYQVGDVVNFSGATAFNGISLGTLNAQHVIHSIGVGSYTTIVGNAANATGSGGGAAVVRSTGRLRVAATAHAQINGQRVKITGAADVGGIVAATYINKEFIIRNVLTNSFDIMTSGLATSFVANGGGASTAYQVEIPVGAMDESFGQGYGMGLYGVGLYGVALQSSTAHTYPRIWFFDRFGTNFIMTAGNQTGLYEWAGANSTAPTLITNAPTAINYAFVSNGIIVTFGAGGVPNRIFACDQFNKTQWTASSSNQVYDYTEVKASQFISHVPVGGDNLIFTPYQTYLFSYLGYTAGVANAIWAIRLLEPNIGLLGAMARVTVDGVAYWMGQHNFYMYDGGFVRVIPANSQEQSTILNYVFSDINRGQTRKNFAWYNEQFDEIWFHYCSAGSNNPDRVARVHRTDFVWSPDTFDRLCAEYPNQMLSIPRLIDSNGVIYQHEQGVDANGVGMPFSITGNMQGRDFGRNAARSMTDDNAMLTGFVPDSVQTGNINVQIVGRRYPQSSTPMFNNTYTVTPTTEFVTTQGGARLWQYTVSSSDLGVSWTAGQWHQYVQSGAKH